MLLLGRDFGSVVVRRYRHAGQLELLGIVKAAIRRKAAGGDQAPGFAYQDLCHGAQPAIGTALEGLAKPSGPQAIKSSLHFLPENANRFA